MVLSEGRPAACAAGSVALGSLAKIAQEKVSSREEEADEGIGDVPYLHTAREPASPTPPGHPVSSVVSRHGGDSLRPRALRRHLHR